MNIKDHDDRVIFCGSGFSQMGVRFCFSKQTPIVNIYTSLYESINSKSCRPKSPPCSCFQLDFDNTSCFLERRGLDHTKLIVSPLARGSVRQLPDEGVDSKHFWGFAFLRAKILILIGDLKVKRFPLIVGVYEIVVWIPACAGMTNKKSRPISSGFVYIRFTFDISRLTFSLFPVVLFGRR